METREKLLDKVASQFGSLKNQNPPMRVDWMYSVAWQIFYDMKNRDGLCLVYLPVENGIGLATQNKRGYVETPCCIADGVNGQDAVDWFNENILGLDKKTCFKIVLTTFRK